MKKVFISIFICFLISAVKSQNPILIKTTDIVGQALPLQISDDISSLSYGTNTFGRQIRLSRQTHLYYYDIGLDLKNELYISKRNTSSVAFKIDKNGYVGIGTTDPKNKLSVKGTIWAEEVKVTLADAADWVFEEDYELRPLEEVETFIKDNKHLPDVPSADEFRENDMNIAEMNNVLLQKIEELTLYLIDQNKKIEEQNKEIQKLKNKI